MVALAQAVLEMLAVVAYRQPVTQAGIDDVWGTTSDSAVGTLLQRGASRGR
jgi:segregation and condensation protein B